MLSTTNPQPIVTQSSQQPLSPPAQALVSSSTGSQLQAAPRLYNRTDTIFRDPAVAETRNPYIDAAKRSGCSGKLARDYYLQFRARKANDALGEHAFPKGKEETKDASTDVTARYSPPLPNEPVQPRITVDGTVQVFRKPDTMRESREEYVRDAKRYRIPRSKAEQYYWHIWATGSKTDSVQRDQPPIFKRTSVVDSQPAQKPQFLAPILGSMSAPKSLRDGTIFRGPNLVRETRDQYINAAKEHGCDLKDA